MKIENFIARFHSNYVISESGCWIWQKSRSKNYPSIKLIKDGRAWYNTRVPYVLFNGPIPDGLIVRHTCDTPACVNPDHLILGTHKDNSRDAVERGRSLTMGRSGVTENPRKRRSDRAFGPRDGENNNQSKLDWNTIRAIRAETDCTLHQLKEKYGISVSQAHRIRNNISWVE